MKRCKDKACVKWRDLDEISHALKSDITVINGLELSIRQLWVRMDCKEDIEPSIGHLNRLRWRLMDRVSQLNDIVIENDKGE